MLAESLPSGHWGTNWNTSRVRPKEVYLEKAMQPEVRATNIEIDMRLSRDQEILQENAKSMQVTDALAHYNSKNKRSAMQSISFVIGKSIKKIRKDVDDGLVEARTRE
jgi:hypothetical protein